MDKLIVIEHMDKVFGNYKAIDDLSFSLEGGKIYGMIGPNGAGTVSYTHLRAHETGRNLVCRLLLEKKKKKKN